MLYRHCVHKKQMICSQQIEAKCHGNQRRTERFTRLVRSQKVHRIAEETHNMTK